MTSDQPVLIRDEPAWTYTSPTGPASRRLRVWNITPAWNRRPHCLVAVITEAGPGMSITNAAYEIATQLGAEHAGDWLEIIEHWPAGTGIDPEEHYDLVQAFSRIAPQWQRLDAADLAEYLPGLDRREAAR